MRRIQRGWLPCGMGQKFWFVYILRCADGSLYTGISNDVKARLRAHNSGKGAFSVRLRRPAQLVWQMYAGTHPLAAVLEYHIKSYTRGQKEELIAGTWQPDFRAGIMERRARMEKKKLKKGIQWKSPPSSCIGPCAGHFFHL